jgi:integrase
LRWVQANHECRSLDDARQYVAAYLQKRIDDDLSAWTIHTDASAIAKLYQCSYRDFGIKLPKRERKNRVKNRTNTLAKELEDNPNSKTVIDLCTNTGLRAHEVKLLKVSDIILDKYNNPAIWVQQGKGGKSRYIHPLDSVVFRLFLEKWQHGEDSLFPSIPAGIPIHFLRGEFARKLYNQYARPLDQIPPEDQYHCRKDMKGVILDRRAMHKVSKELGHNRIGVVTLYLT